MVYFASMVTDVPPLLKKEREEKRKIIGATKIEQDRWRKKNVGETMEKLDAMGSPDEKKGIAATQAAYKEYEEENFRIKSDRIAWLNSKSKFAKHKIDYYRYVDEIVRYEMSFLELPFGYQAKSMVTDQGIKLILLDRWGELHIGAFSPCGLGVYDEQACRTSVNKLDDAVTYLEKHPPSGVYLP